jgi:hypothetical protein
MWSSKERGYIYGLFEGDGYAYHNKKDRHYSVDFYLNSERDKDIEKFLVNLLKKEGFIVHLFKDKRFNCKRIRVHSKEFFNFINKSEKNIGGDYKMGFVSGLIDSEGSVSSKKSAIVVTNTNLELMNTAKKFLDDLHIPSNLKDKKIGPKEKLPQKVLFISIKFKSVNHLSKKAGRLN